MHAEQAHTADREVSPELPNAEDPLVGIPSLLAPFPRGEQLGAISTIGEAISSGYDGAGIDVESDAVEIPSEASEALQSWDRILANVDRQLLPLQFCRAATEILRFASTKAAPEHRQ